MPGTPFHKLEYWDERFTRDQSTFDWLLPPETLDKTILDLIATFSGPVRIHHIGCGTSSFSLRLRRLVTDLCEIHNTDFSQKAIEVGQSLEHAVLENNNCDANDQTQALSGVSIQQSKPNMRWTRVDLLCRDQILSLPGPYHITIDKSTSDSISCGDDVPVTLPYPLRPLNSDLSFRPLPPSIQPKVHPLHLLALHLAFLTPCGGFWLAVSYSDHRFPYWPPYPNSADEGLLPQEIIDAGFVHPGTLWKLRSQERLDATPPETSQERLVSRPKIMHSLYVMIRTDVDLVNVS